MLCNLESDVRRILQNIRAPHRNSLPVGFLVNDRTLETEFTAAGLQNQIAFSVRFDLAGTFDFELNQSRIGSRGDREVVLQLLMVSVVDQINSRIQILVADSPVGWYFRMPIRRIVADEIIHSAELSPLTHNGGILGRSSQPELYGRSRSRRTRLVIGTSPFCVIGTTFVGRKERTMLPEVRNAVYPLPRNRNLTCGLV